MNDPTRDIRIRGFSEMHRALLAVAKEEGCPPSCIMLTLAVELPSTSVVTDLADALRLPQSQVRRALKVCREKSWVEGGDKRGKATPVRLLPDGERLCRTVWMRADVQAFISQLKQVIQQGKDEHGTV